MDDNKHKPDGAWGVNGDNNNKPQETPESDSSYYYSYGPYQSYGKDREESREEYPSYERRQPEEVEVTRPQPVQPIPSSYDIRPSSDGLRGSNGGGGTPPGKSNGNWQYNKPPKKTSFKSVIAGGLAGMLILLGGMVYADTQNLFTGNKSVAIPVSTSNSSSETKNNESNSTAATASFAMTNPGDVTSVVKQAGAAVVKIETLVKSSKQSRNNAYNTDPFYRYFFGDNSAGSGNSNDNGGRSSGNSDPLVPTGIGSGFIFEKDGYILTNEHVVHNADVVQVTLQDTEKPYEAKVLGTSYELDLAVLKIEGDNFPSIPMGDSDNTVVGEWLVAIGNPQGFDHTVTAGVLSAKERGGIKSLVRTVRLIDNMSICSKPMLPLTLVTRVVHFLT